MTDKTTTATDLEADNLPDSVLAGDDRIPIDWNTDPISVQRKIVDKILNAKTVDELFDVYAGDATSSLENKVFNILEVSFTPYESERGVIPMAHVDGVLEGQDEITSWRTTATSIVAMLAKLHQLEAFPLRVRIVSAKTSSGYKAFHLERA
jgi:hypothetical protein